MKRPIPVILTAVLLVFLALFQLAGTLLMIGSGILFLHKGLPVPATPMPTPLPASFLPIMMFALSLFYAALAVWSILTLVGLLRMRSWARYSVLVMAGCVTFFGAIATLTMIAMPFMMRSMPMGNQPAPDPGLMRGTFIFMGVLYAICTAVAIAMLVYYNLAKTRAIFQQNAPINLGPPNTSTGRPRPTAITIISWFFLISGPFTLLYAFLPFPAFLLGFTFSGPAAHMLYAIFAILGFAIGYGLFRLRPESRIAFLALMIFGFFNMFAILTPWGSRNFHAYMDKFVPHASIAAAPNPFASTGFILVCFTVSAAINLFVLWLLHRHREAFTPAPPPPPMPVLDAPLAG